MNNTKAMTKPLVFNTRSFFLLFLCAMLAAFVSLIVYPYGETARAENLFAKTSIYFFNGLFVLWVYCLVSWRETVFSKIELPVHAGALLAAFLLTLVVWFGVEHSFKVLSDESNLMAISRSMTYEKTAYNHTMGRWYYDNFWPLANQIDKRPILFPYALQLLHVVRGYAIENVFILNSFFLFLFLYLVFVLVYPVAGFLGGLAGMFLVLAQPILSITAISGGFDLFACLLQFWVLYLVFQLCEKENPEIRPLIWYSLLLLVHARYENMLAFPIVIGVLGVFGKFPLSEFKKKPYLYGISPVFLLPRIWQFLMPQNYENPAGVPVIGWQNFMKHLPVFINNFANMTYDLPYASILNVIALVIVLVWLEFFLLKRTEILPFKYFPFALVLLGFAFSELTITLSHHFGVFDHPTQSRLFLVFMVSLSLSPFLLKGILGKVPSKILLMVSVFLFLIYFPIAQENRFVDKLTLIRKTHWAYSFLDTVKEKNILVVVDRPGVYTIREIGAVDFNWVKSNIQMVREDFAHHLYQDIYVIEDIPYTTNKSEVDNLFEFETVFERQNTPEAAVKILKVKKIL